jgi:hypothetical protein
VVIFQQVGSGVVYISQFGDASEGIGVVEDEGVDGVGKGKGKNEGGWRR